MYSTKKGGKGEYGEFTGSERNEGNARNIYNGGIAGNRGSAYDKRNRCN